MPGERNLPNVIVEMFEWWNEAYRRGAFTAEGFARYFADEAPFVVGGAPRGTGPREISNHFEAIRNATDSVVLVLPVRDSLVSPEVGFVHYEVRAERAGVVETEECLAVARFRNGLITSFQVMSRPT